MAGEKHTQSRSSQAGMTKKSTCATYSGYLKWMINVMSTYCSFHVSKFYLVTYKSAHASSLCMIKLALHFLCRSNIGRQI